MIKKVPIHLKEISTPDELFILLSATFSFPAYFGHNWDALFDMMQSLSPESLGGEDPTGVHLVLQEFDHIQEVFSEDELVQLYSLLVDLSVSPEYREDGLRFTFEIQYS
jgi:hypothetical protein